MSATATAEPKAHGHIDFADNKTDAGMPRTRATTPENLTDAERERLWAASKDYDEFTDKAIAYGKLTGDFTIDRHIMPQRTHDEIIADILRIQAEHPERFTVKPVRWAD
ncbi:MAG: hypothetical protein LBB74_01065 [Chitinispirillales bacterium]|jgi:hypothetical protein|nr:hypothetical protein [Chitinispirillales bacterium]